MKALPGVEKGLPPLGPSAPGSWWWEAGSSGQEGALVPRASGEKVASGVKGGRHSEGSVPPGPDRTVVGRSSGGGAGTPPSPSSSSSEESTSRMASCF